jgi:hypothetical protein
VFPKNENKGEAWVMDPNNYALLLSVPGGFGKK